MSEERPDLSNSKPLTEDARSKLEGLLPEGSDLTNVICINRPGTGQEWYYDTDTDTWIAPCVC